jgi:hypothetical protein
MATKDTDVIFTPSFTNPMVPPSISRIPSVGVVSFQNGRRPPRVPSEGSPFITIEARLPLALWMRRSLRYLSEYCSKTKTHPHWRGSAPTARGLAKTIDESRVREGAGLGVTPPTLLFSLIYIRYEALSLSVFRQKMQLPKPSDQSFSMLLHI